MAELTIINSTRPATLSKKVRRARDGALIRECGGLLVEGEARIATVSSLSDLGALLEELGPAQALTFGVPRGSNRKIMSRATLARRGSPNGVTTRTRDQFDWPKGGGILMLDHDPGDRALSRDDLVGIIRGAAPGLQDAAMLWWPSASSHICDGTTDEDLTGLRGQRLYLLVADAADIPRAGAALVDRLWVAGRGHIVVSAAGAALERCPIDASVWQPERLDFAAGAVCHDGLVQRRGSPILIPGSEVPVDTRDALPDDPVVIKAANTARRRARAEAREAMVAARDAFVEARIEAMLSPDERSNEDAQEKARGMLRRALDRQVLSGAFLVEVEVSPGIFEDTTVEHILENRTAFHGRLTRDPLEPDYDGGRAVGKLFLLDARPILFSFARHGRSFRLVLTPLRIEVPKGRVVSATDAALGALRDDPAVFDFGGQIAIVDSDAMSILDEHSLGYALAGSIQFWHKRKLGGDVVEADIDPPAKLVRQLLSLGLRRHLKPLTAVITAPTIRPDGTILSAPGYDPATSLLLSIDEPIEVTPSPSRPEVDQALRDLLHPFEGFPLVDRFARGGLLAALLTAVVRPALATAPAFAMDAPVQGSGKTLLASCIAALATGRVPDVWPHTAGRDDEEVRKRLFAALRDGPTALIWDNITGVFDSAALASAITAPIIRDRVLGRSECLSIPNRALLLLTGNNFCPAGDLPRRIITVRIDPGTDAPFARRFDLDPLDYVLVQRSELARSALVLIRGWLSSGAPRAEGRMASFEAWDDIVRQTVCWIDAEIAPGGFGDPLALVLEAQGSDPEQESYFALLEALEEKFARRWFTARDVREHVSRARAGSFNSLDGNALVNALTDIGGERSMSSAKSIGRLLKFREGRIAFGLRLQSKAGRSGREYRIEEVGDAAGRGFGGFGGFASGSSAADSRTKGRNFEGLKSNPLKQPNPHSAASEATEEW